MTCQDLEHSFAVTDATAGFDLVSQHRLRAIVVQHPSELEFPILPRSGNGPTGETACHLDDVLLGVSSVDAKCMELHQFARVVLVESQFPIGSARRFRIVVHLWI